MSFPPDGTPNIDPATGLTNWVSTATEDDSRATLHPGRLSITPAGNVLVAGGSNGNVHLGTEAFASSDRDRGHSWRWTLETTTGAKLDLQAWQTEVGYYGHARQAHRSSEGTAVLVRLRGRIDYGVGTIGMGSGLPEEPTGPAFATFDSAGAATSARAFTAAPYDAVHALTLHADWNSCADTVSASIGINTTGATSNVDFGAGSIAVPADTLNIAVYGATGNLDSFTTRPLGNPYERIHSVSVAPRERAAYLTSSNGNRHSGRIQRIGY